MAERIASTPNIGAARDAARTLLGFLLALVIAKVAGESFAASEPVQTGIVVLTSAALAWFGKFIRDRSGFFGKLI
jgi:hypothetical protein